MDQHMETRARRGAGRARAAWALTGWALLAGCSLIVDKKLEGRTDGGAPADMQLPPDTGPGPGPDAPTVGLELLTPAIWPNGELRLAVHVENFALRPDKMGSPPAPGEGHYIVAIDDGGGLFIELPPGAHTDYVVDFGIVRSDAGVLRPGPYKITVTLVDNAGMPLDPPASASEKFEVCGLDYRSSACGDEPPPPIPEACAPQEACMPPCGASCPECMQQPVCNTGGVCLRISTIQPVVVAPGSPMQVELEAQNFNLVSPPTEPPPPPHGPEGYYRMGLEGGPAMVPLLEDGANPTEVFIPPSVPPRDEPYLLFAELLHPDGSPLKPPVRACWPVFVLEASVTPVPEPKQP